MSKHAVQPANPADSGGRGKERRWTAQQRAALEHVGGDLLVSAAAGSGKTAVLAERCARLVCEQISAEEGRRCGVENLLVLTFTEAAAGEMRGRIADAIRRRLGAAGGAEDAPWLRRQAAMVERASISTLHAFCAHVLRQHFHEAGIDPAFEVMDEEEAGLLREEVLEEMLADWHRLPAQGGDNGSTAAAFAEFFEAYAQGRDGACGELILRVYQMLASTADPERYLAEARNIYSDAGKGGMAAVEHFLEHTLGDEVRLARLLAQRACADIGRAIGPCEMLRAIEGAAAAIDLASERLRERDIVEARAALAYAWPKRLTGMKEISQFDSLKGRYYQKLKDLLKDLREETLASDPAELLGDLKRLAAPLDTLLALVADFTRRYAAAKREQNRLDFADLERLTLDLLTPDASLVAAEIRRRYHFVLVDEFQDINPLQKALLEAVRSPARLAGRGNLFVVGDVKQSIYGFRLADPTQFLEWERRVQARSAAADARESGGTGLEYVSLPHNFRSRPRLIAAMNAVFERLLTPEVARIRYADGHALEPAPEVKPAVRGRPAPPVEVHLLARDADAEENEPNDDGHGTDDADQPVENLSAVEEEARMVAARLAALLAEKRLIQPREGEARPIQARDVAILLRTMKNKALIFARALARHGIRVHAELSTGYFDAPEVLDTLALLQTLDNAQQDVPLATVLLGPFGRFSHDDLAVIRLTFDTRTVPFHKAAARYVRDGARMKHGGGRETDAGRDPPPFDADLAARLIAFQEKLARWRGLVRTRPLHEGLAEIYADSRIVPYLSALDAGEQRIANLQALHQRALKFASFRKQGLHRFLRFIERLRAQETDFGEAPVVSEASDVVRIMSIHKSKGLEFPVVCVCGLGAPLRLTEPGPVLVHRELHIGLKVADIERNIYYPSAASANIAAANERSSRAEELRLLYVAMTRAQEQLILTGHINKAEQLEERRAAWQAHAGPLPEDALLRGRNALDWLLPALAGAPLKIRWPRGGGQSIGDVGEADLTIDLHAPAAARAEEARVAAVDANDEVIRRLCAGEPLSSPHPTPPAPLTPGTPEESASRVIERLRRPYTHQVLVSQPAVMTVTQLKSRADEAERERNEVAAAPLKPSEPAGGSATLRRSAGADEARERGIATHHVLELVDLAAFARGADLPGEIARLVKAGKLGQEEAAAADRAGIEWLLTRSATGKRLLAAAGDPEYEVRREIRFIWVAPVTAFSAAGIADLGAAGTGQTDPADWPTIRGVIDALIVHKPSRRAEILDYKTDSAFTWEGHLEEYRRQMQYYLRAASDILEFTVGRATLLFIAPQRENAVDWPITS